MTISITLFAWFMLTPLVMLWLQKKKLSAWKKTDGAVVELSGPNEEGYAAIVDFVTESGKNCTLYDRWRSNVSRYAVGQRVKICYDPKKPSNAVILSFGGVYFLRYVAISFAVTLPLLVLALLFQR